MWRSSTSVVRGEATEDEDQAAAAAAGGRIDGAAQ